MKEICVPITGPIDDKHWKVLLDLSRDGLHLTSREAANLCHHGLAHGMMKPPVWGMGDDQMVYSGNDSGEELLANVFHHIQLEQRRIAAELRDAAAGVADPDSRRKIEAFADSLATEMEEFNG